MTPTPPASRVAPPEATATAPDLRGHGERIERLLEDLRAMAGPSTWQRVEEMLRLLVELYGDGLARLIRHARESGAEAPALQQRVSDDELLSSLLLLHGLHPAGVEERVRGAVEKVRARLGAAGGAIELLAIEGDTVRIRAPGAGAGSCPSSRAPSAHVVQRAIQDAAPEIARVEIDGAAPAASGRLVTIGGLHRESAP